MATLQFLGATGTVTGSKYLLEHDGFRMLVDCGLFQGLKDLRLRNWSAPPFDPAKLDLIALTHAHLDHVGYLPVVARDGYRGRVLCTSATVAVSGIVLPDSGHIQEEDARYANKRGFSKHRPALPLYTEEDARNCLRQLEVVGWDKTVQVHDSVSLRFLPAGHILGAAFIEVRLAKAGPGGGEKVVVFSGDLGRLNQPIVPDPALLPPCDHLLLESTYGNRDHGDEDPKERLESLVKETVARGGTLLIPSFAVGRTQHLLYLFRELQREGRFPRDVPIWLDSPMAIEATRVTLDHPEAHDGVMRAADARGQDPLGVEALRCAVTPEQSKSLNNAKYPAVIISASGMATGGRILHHLSNKLPDHRTTVLFAGFQAAGTRGRSLTDGAKTVKIHGRQVTVRARVETLGGLSAHADRGEILKWLHASHATPGRVHLVHGEPDARDALAALLREKKGLDVSCPDYLEKVEL